MTCRLCQHSSVSHPDMDTYLTGRGLRVAFWTLVVNGFWQFLLDTVQLDLRIVFRLEHFLMCACTPLVLVFLEHCLKISIPLLLGNDPPFVLVHESTRHCHLLYFGVTSLAADFILPSFGLFSWLFITHFLVWIKESLFVFASPINGGSGVHFCILCQIICGVYYPQLGVYYPQLNMNWLYF